MAEDSVGKAIAKSLEASYKKGLENQTIADQRRAADPSYIGKGVKTARAIKAVAPLAIAGGLLSGKKADAAEIGEAVIGATPAAPLAEWVNPSKAGGGFSGNEEGELVKSIDNRKKKVVSKPRSNLESIGGKTMQYGSGRN